MIYPIFLELKGRPVLVVGGGMVAGRKAAGFVGAGAVVTVVSPDLSPELAEMAEEGKITWRRKCFSREDVGEAFLIIAATNDRETNFAVKKAAGSHQLVTIADNPDASDFHVPSIVRQGKLTLAVSTSGASPSLAKKIRLELEEKYGDQYTDYLDFLDESRKKIIGTVQDAGRKRELLSLLAKDETLLDKKRRLEMAERLDKLIREGTD
ncbi:precorrin-2 dehydrogenase/sirohydrochlorin ferrochelatase family protein [Bacillus sp. B-jedd]|uniref:precorrin-2 dehydrogenase/sirohydrochlorin ferrochelatase family protein n=1 Tax=Bacillus sp. B-jedd TaxID=1476857 RepID=UPI00051558CE|nr:NAD(P)-dependent oxidoreductase [Bacillus sp. B-jedd]CEG26414.1 precorrin-2 dehydrogenase [Bacillus sp. B-jedd]